MPPVTAGAGGGVSSATPAHSVDSGSCPASHRSAVQVAQQPGSDGLRLPELESKLFQDIRLVAEDVALQKGYVDLA